MVVQDPTFVALGLFSYDILFVTNVNKKIYLNWKQVLTITFKKLVALLMD